MGRNLQLLMRRKGRTQEGRSSLLPVSNATCACVIFCCGVPAAGPCLLCSASSDCFARLVLLYAAGSLCVWGCCCPCVGPSPAGLRWSVLLQFPATRLARVLAVELFRRRRIGVPESTCHGDGSPCRRSWTRDRVLICLSGIRTMDCLVHPPGGTRLR